MMLANLARRVFGRKRWRWVETPEEVEAIDIGSLICPLRYDEVVRRQFLEFYEANRELYASSRRQFMSLARQQPYVRWKMWRFHAYHAFGQSSDTALQEHLDARIVRFVTLCEEIEAQGFDQRKPIEVRIADRILPTRTGKQVRQQYVLGDGGHRLSYLMVRGDKVIPRGHFRLRWFSELEPYDSTAILVKTIPLDETAYAGFLSMAYGDGTTCGNLAELLNRTAAAQPDRLEELRGVIAADGYTRRRTS